MPPKISCTVSKIIHVHVIDSLNTIISEDPVKRQRIFIILMSTGISWQIELTNISGAKFPHGTTISCD